MTKHEKLCEFCLNAAHIADLMGVAVPVPAEATAAQLMHDGHCAKVRMLCDEHHDQVLSDATEIWGMQLEDPWLAWPRQVH